MTPIEEIKSRLDIVELVRGYLKLEKSGQNWRAICPFHTEKTPSFFVSPSRQSWHCFGACNEGGDVFSFLMKIERIDFPEALKILADRTGVRLPQQDPKFRTERNLLFEILERAATIFEKNLREARSPMQYLLDRGLAPETIKTFRLGWSLPSWRGLFDELVKYGYKPEMIERAGLIIKSQDQNAPGYYDRFRGRIMFPLFDATGRVAGFTGRIFEQDSSSFGKDSGASPPAKYVNTPESPVFQKGKMLYGYHLAKNAIAQSSSALLVEGQMDFLAAWQEGIKNVVATSGTALTEIQLSILKRLADNLVLGFDMDKAGDQATERSILVAASLGFNLQVLTLPEGKDISDFTKTHPGELGRLLENPRHLMEYYFAKAKASYSAETVEGRKKYVEYLMPRLKALGSPTERAYWVAELSKEINTPESVLEEELKRSTPFTEGVRFAEESPEEPASKPTKTRREMLAERALAFALKFKEERPALAAFVEYFPDEYKALADSLAAGIKENPNNETVNYLGMLADYELGIKPDLNVKTDITRALAELKKVTLKEKLLKAQQELQMAERAKDETEANRLAMEISILTKELSKNYLVK